MATEYYKLREPITGITLQPVHTARVALPEYCELTMYSGFDRLGVLTLKTDILPDFLKMLSDTTATAVMVTGIGVDVRMRIEEPNLTNLISELGELRSLDQIKSDWSNQIEMYRRKSQHEAKQEDRTGSTAVGEDPNIGSAVAESSV